jgi:hypothetical protein
MSLVSVTVSPQSTGSALTVRFVGAAGNSNEDSSFNESIPASIKAPNLFTAGAVDKAGDEAVFTS